jgi:hypothetical protein
LGSSTETPDSDTSRELFVIGTCTFVFIEHPMRIDEKMLLLTPATTPDALVKAPDSDTSMPEDAPEAVVASKKLIAAAA